MSFSELMEFAKEKFFPGGKNEKLGRIAAYTFEMGNSSGDIIPKESSVNGKKVPMTLSAYVAETCVSRCRFYQLLKKLTDSIAEPFVWSSSESDDEFMTHKTAKKKPAKAIVKQNISDRTIDTSSIKPGSSNLIGSSSEREILRKQID